MENQVLEQQKEPNSRLRNKFLKMTEKENKKTKEKPETSEEIIKDIEKSGIPKEIAKKEEKLDEKAIKKSEEKVEKKEVKPEKKPETKKEEEKESKAEKSKETEKKPVQEKPAKTEAVVKSYNLPISTKYSAAICKFIKNKRIEEAITDLEQVLKFRKVIPMKGEIPHRKGRGIMSGRFPKKATESFIKLLKNLSANASYSGLEEPVIAESVANIGSRPYGKFGAVRKKRTHVEITARNKEREKSFSGEKA